MADRSGIEWTEATWNPVTGCTKVSPGCDHCYAERITERFRGPGSFARVTLHETRLDVPRRWRAPRRIFVNSMSDLFHEQVSDEFIAAVFAAMLSAQRHTFQVLTKRHARMRALLRRHCFQDQVFGLAVDRLGLPPERDHRRWWPVPNVWLGVSVEEQKWADIRIPALLETPAAVRFLSCEPLLGPIDLIRAVVIMGDQRGHGLTASFAHAGGCCRRFHGLDWVIVGGESGPGNRPMHPDWARSLRDQCQQADVAFFFKQWGGSTSKAGGRLLDGRTWDEVPTSGVALSASGASA